WADPREVWWGLAEVQAGYPNLFIGPRLAGVFRDDLSGHDNGTADPALRPPQRGIRLQRHQVTRIDRERMIEQPLGLAKPFLATGIVVAVEEFEDEGRGDAGQAVNASGFDLERLLEQIARRYHRGRRRRQIEGRLRAHDEMHRPGAVRPLLPAPPRFDADDLQADRPRHPPHDLVLNLQHAHELSVKTFRPKLACFPRIDEPDIDAHAFSVERHAAFEEIADLKIAANLARIRPLPFVGECGGAGHDGDSGQRT